MPRACDDDPFLYGQRWAIPRGTLIQARDGNFYGTTGDGGANLKGTVFKMDSSGAVTTLHSFAGSDGDNPSAGLTQGSDGNFYGTTYNGGATDQGTVFKMDASGAVTMLHDFTGSDGIWPQGQLVEGSDGNFYGTTVASLIGDVVLGEGTVFKITPSGALTVLHSFAKIDGESPSAGLIQGSEQRSIPLPGPTD